MHLKIMCILSGECFILRLGSFAGCLVPFIPCHFQLMSRKKLGVCLIKCLDFDKTLYFTSQQALTCLFELDSEFKFIRRL